MISFQNLVAQLESAGALEALKAPPKAVNVKPKPNPKYKPLTDAQFAKQWKTYVANNPDVAVEFGNNLEGALKHYKESGIADIQSGLRSFSSVTPALINSVGIQYPEQFKLIDPKTNKHTSTFSKYFPDLAREYIRENYTSIYDTTPNLFDSKDLTFLRTQKIAADQITDLARSYGIGSINPNLLKYNAKTKKYATPELSSIAGDIYANYATYDAGQKGIFDQSDVSLLRSLGYTDSDIVNRARTLFGEDRLSPEVIQQYFPDLALRAPKSLYLDEPLTIDRDIRGAEEKPSVQETIGGRSVEPEAPTIRTGQAPEAPTIETTTGTTGTTGTTQAPLDFPSWFKGIPGAEPGAAPVELRTGPAVVNPMVEYFANTPIASPFPTLPYRFQTLSPENVNFRQGLGTLPTSNPLLAPAPAPAAPAISSGAPPLGPSVPTLNPQLQYITPAPTAAEIQALIAAQAAPVATEVVPVATEAAPVTGRMGGRVSFAEGGMPKFSPAEVGSQVDVNEYINPETGKFRINEYQRDVVFNPRLREAEEQERARYAQNPLLQLEEMDRLEKQRNADLLMYGYGIRRPRPFAEGGLASVAQDLADKGRGPDTMLVHMAPDEIAGLQALAQQQGTSLTINPYTGLPEAFSLSSLNPVKAVKKVYKEVVKPVVKGIESGIEGLAKKLGPVGQIAAAYFGGPIGAAVYAGVAPEGSGFDLKRAALAGGLTYATTGTLKPSFDYSSLGSSAAESAATAGAADAAASAPLETLAPPPTDVAALTSNQVGAVQAPGYADIEIPGVTSFSGATPPPPPTYLEQASKYISDLPGRVSQGIQNLPQTVAELPGKALDYAIDKPIQTAFIGSQLFAAKEAKDEMEEYEQEQRRLAEEEERRRRMYSDLFSRTLGRVPMAAGGGIVALAKGGMPTFEYGGTTAPTGEPRMVKGAGDGMSDNVPATIEGVQEARLANDEFVVPADVVADIGNGSSNAGAKKLYAMMDRVRKARHGTVKQPPEIRAERFMPA